MITTCIQEINQNIKAKEGFELDDWQVETITTLMSGRDVVTTAPTGGGKSTCFAYISNTEPSDTIALIIAPTKALINDQVQFSGS